jgi:hypothetical protein
MSRGPIVWNGSDLALLYSEEETLYFTRIDLDGNPLREPLALGDFHNTAQLAWTGSSYGVAGTNSDGDVRFVMLEADVGTEVPNAPLIGAGYTTSLVALPSGGWALAFHGGPTTPVPEMQLFLARIGENGVQLGNEAVVGQGFGWQPSIGLHAGTLGIAWAPPGDDAQGTSLLFARLDEEGAVMGEVVPITPRQLDGFPFVAGDDNGWVVATIADTEGSVPSPLRVTFVAGDGSVTGDQTVSTSAIAAAFAASTITAANGAFAVGWEESGEGAYFTTVCP